MLRDNIIKDYVSINDLTEFALLDIADYDIEKETILILDDAIAITVLTYKLCKRAGLTEKYNIVVGHGFDVAMQVIKTVHAVSVFQVNYVLTDITFSSNIVVNNNSYNFNGIDLVGFLLRCNSKLKYRFLTAHNVNINTTPKMFKSYQKYAVDELLDYVEPKDKKISTNLELIHKLVGYDV